MLIDRGNENARKMKNISWHRATSHPIGKPKTWKFADFLLQPLQLQTSRFTGKNLLPANFLLFQVKFCDVLHRLRICYNLITIKFITKWPHVNVIFTKNMLASDETVLFLQFPEIFSGFHNLHSMRQWLYVCLKPLSHWVQVTSDQWKKSLAKFDNTIGSHISENLANK